MRPRPPTFSNRIITMMMIIVRGKRGLTLVPATPPPPKIEFYTVALGSVISHQFCKLNSGEWLVGVDGGVGDAKTQHATQGQHTWMTLRCSWGTRIECENGNGELRGFTCGHLMRHSAAQWVTSDQLALSWGCYSTQHFFHREIRYHLFENWLK